MNFNMEVFTFAGLKEYLGDVNELNIFVIQIKK